MAIAQIERRLNGVLTNATTVTLANTGDVYGIRRADTGAVSVAAGAATTNPSTGIYQYDYGALDESQVYEVSWKFVTGTDTEYAVQVLTPKREGFRYIHETLRALRERVGRLTGFGHFDTALAGAAGTVTLERAKAFVDDAWVGGLAYITDGVGFGQSRVVTDHVQSTGVLTISPNWTTTPTTTSRIEVWMKDLSPEIVNNALALALLQIQHMVPVKMRVNPAAFDATNLDNVTLPSEIVKVYGFEYLTSARLWQTHKPVDSVADLRWMRERSFALTGNIMYLYPSVPSDRARTDLYVLGYRHPTTLMAAGELAEGPSAFLVYTAAALIESQKAGGQQIDPEQHSGRAANWLRMAASIPLTTRLEPDTLEVGP